MAATRGIRVAIGAIVAAEIAAVMHDRIFDIDDAHARFAGAFLLSDFDHNISP